MVVPDGVALLTRIQGDVGSIPTRGIYNNFSDV